MSNQPELSPTSAAPKKPIKRHRARGWIIPAIIVAGLLGGWWGWRHATTPAANSAADAGDIVSVTKGDVEKAIESSGKVVSNLDVDIKCRASGEITQLPFDISDAVKKGDLLCELDPTDENLAVRSAKAAVDEAQAKVAQAQYDLEQAQENLVTTKDQDDVTLASAKVKATNLRAKANRAKDLFNQKLGSREDMESMETDASTAEAAQKFAAIAIDQLHQQEIQLEYKQEAVKTAQAQAQAAQVTYEAQQQQLTYTKVISPIDGVVSALNVQKGAIIASGVSGFSGGTTILTLSDLSRVFVTATVDESNIGGVRVGQDARITVASFPGRTFAGKVTRIATKGVNTSNVVTFEVKVEVLDDHKNILRPEMTGSVNIILDHRTNVLTLPAAAINTEDGKSYVTAPGGKKLPVTLGLQSEDTVEILSGVSAGQKVVVSAAELPTRWKSAMRGGPRQR